MTLVETPNDTSLIPRPSFLSLAIQGAGWGPGNEAVLVLRKTGGGHPVLIGGKLVLGPRVQRGIQSRDHMLFTH